MNAPHTNPLAPHSLQLLQDYLRMSASTVSETEALDAAIKAWIAQEKAGAEVLHGYQWKQLFLPDGTRVRMEYLERSYFARVVGDQLTYGGASVSPRAMTLTIAGDGRKAWRDLWLRLPGERDWVNAKRLRARATERVNTPPPSAADALTSAARAMGQALTAAVTLIEHVDHQTTTVLERRTPKDRRLTDLLEDID
jgi:hypothetical protein